MHRTAARQRVSHLLVTSTVLLAAVGAACADKGSDAVESDTESWWHGTGDVGDDVREGDGQPDVRSSPGGGDAAEADFSGDGRTEPEAADGGPQAEVAPEVTVLLPLECRAEGLFEYGVLMVPSDPMEDPSPECESSSIELYPDGGFHACCGEECCEYLPGDVVEPGGPGAACQVDGDCAFGLACIPGTFGQSTCGFVGEGGTCANDLFCGPGLYCGVSGTCKAPAEGEGAVCFGNDQECAWPMRCVCHGLTCQCLDGSIGDPCQSDTCAAGLYCYQGGPWGQGKCQDGGVGDSCASDWQCNPGLGCAGLKGGKAACATWLPEGADCSESGPSKLAVCEKGTVCLSFGSPPVCAVPGGEEEPCALDSECQDGLFCNTTVEQCFDGKDGDPCSVASDCAQGQTCATAPDGKKRCMVVLPAGAACGDLALPWWKCAGNTVCLYSLSPPACGKPVDAGSICLSDGECGDGLACLESAGVCVPGGSLMPCGSDEWCLSGLQCMGLVNVCSDGGPDAPCDEGKCQEGLFCDPVLRLCLDGGVGASCSDASDCQPGLQCLLLWETGVCVSVMPVGGACTPGGWALCHAGLFCADPPGVCSAGLEGQACANDGQCAEGLRCHPSLNGCYAGTQGDPCGPDFPCAPGYLCPKEGGQCGQATEGAWCDDASDCAGVLKCVLSVSECHDGKNGDPCAGGQDCVDGFQCDAVLGLCSDGKVGAPCLDDSWCVDGMVCKDIGELRCVVLVEEGDTCGPLWTTFIICPEGTTCNGGYDPPQCAAPGGAGDPCWEDVDCKPGFHCLAQGPQCEADSEGGQP